MAEHRRVWSLEADCERYERLLAQVKAGKFWTGDKPGRPTEEEFRRQVERLQNIVDQLHEVIASRAA